MNRSQILDQMTEADKQADLLKSLASCDFIRLYNRQQVAFWQAAAEALKAQNLVTFEFIDNEREQESYYEIRKCAA